MWVQVVGAVQQARKAIMRACLVAPEGFWHRDLLKRKGAKPF